MAGSGFILSYRPGTAVTGAGGAAVELWEAASNPGVTNDDVDTAGIGKAFNPGDLWRNTATGVVWVCMSAATGAASWRINVVSVTGSPSDHEIPRFEGATGQLLQGSGVTMTDGGVLTLPSGGGVNVNTGKAVLSATSLVLSSAMAIGSTPSEAKGLVLRNSTAAADGAQQYSPATYWAGQGWKTIAPASGEIAFRAQCQPVQGAGLHGGEFVFSSSIAGAAYVDLLTLNARGGVDLPVGSLTVGAVYVEPTALYLDGALAIGVTPAESTSLVLRNSTAAANGAQQIAPVIYQMGCGWGSGAGASASVGWRQVMTPVQQAVAVSTIEWQTYTGGAWGTYRMLVDHTGNVFAGESLFAVTGVLEVGRTNTTVDATPLGLGTAGSYTLSLESTRASGSGNVSVAVVADVDAAINAAHKVLSIGYTTAVPAWTELWHFRGDGELRSAATTAATITGAEADGATAIGVKLNTSTAYSTAGAKLLSVQNNGVEKVHVTDVGTIYLAAPLAFAAYTVAAPPAAPATGQLQYFSNGDAGAPCLAVYTGAAWLRVVLGTAIASS